MPIKEFSGTGIAHRAMGIFLILELEFAEGFQRIKNLKINLCKKYEFFGQISFLK